MSEVIEELAVTDMRLEADGVSLFDAHPTARVELSLCTDGPGVPHPAGEVRFAMPVDRAFRMVGGDMGAVRVQVVAEEDDDDE